MAKERDQGEDKIELEEEEKEPESEEKIRPYYIDKHLYNKVIVAMVARIIGNLGV